MVHYDHNERSPSAPCIKNILPNKIFRQRDKSQFYDWTGLWWRELILSVIATLSQLFACFPVLAAPILVGAFFIFDALRLTSLGSQILTFLILCFLLIGLLLWMIYSFRCPRCGNLFFVNDRRLSQGQELERCAHCGLRKGQLFSDEE